MGEVTEGALRLDGTESCVVFAWNDGVPRIAYHGRRLHGDNDLNELVASQTPMRAPATLDTNEGPSLHPENARGWLGYPAMMGRRQDDTAAGGSSGWTGRFSLTEVEELDAGVSFRLRDRKRELTLTLHCALDPATDVLSFRSSIRNDGSTPFVLDWLAVASLHPPQQFDHLRSFHGRWCGEFNMERRPVPLGLTLLENRRGRTSHEHFPGIVLSHEWTHEDDGECVGVHLGWSGNHRVVLERLANGDTQLQMGVLFVGAEGELAAGASWETPTLYATHSSCGLSAMSQQFHAFVRTQLLKFPRPERPRPVTVNTWEAIYFDHERERLHALVDAAALLGAERFVLDDGWFRGRNDDTTSLGDWFVDVDKYPSGLRPLADYVRAAGMEFGLWVEPEMVNPDSELYRAHPDWTLEARDYPRVTGRHQLLLDLSKPAVTDYLFERLESVVAENDVGYLKWDMNREFVVPADSGGSARAYAQTEAVYALMARLRERFDHLEIESCASGGGRADYGILRYCHRFWPSDSNDPIERLKIQSGFSYFFPPEVMGSHVGPRFSRTSGRGLHPGLRVLSASFGHFGIEADIVAADEEERAAIRAAVARYKRDRKVWHEGRLFRIQTADPSLFAFASVDATGTAARVVVVQGERPRATRSPRLRVPGLAPTRRYRVRLEFLSEMAREANSDFSNPLWDDGVVLSGQVLAELGVVLPALYPQTGLQLNLDLIDT